MALDEAKQFCREEKSTPPPSTSLTFDASRPPRGRLAGMPLSSTWAPPARRRRWWRTSKASASSRRRSSATGNFQTRTRLRCAPRSYMSSYQLALKHSTTALDERESCRFLNNR